MSKKKTLRVSGFTPFVEVPLDTMVDENERLCVFAEERKERQVFTTDLISVLLMAW